ncbi:hypothetical protein SCLCIDRAFT_1214552 [Scleroderma citrinum Foug A]|uniref:Uncharacterized protein n=1 Tax=Scleroderma citrinum Foug A TaxID=1036808 RepID=A0A0C3E3F8_9AGAM|nr:hypothetical protein SCLCIDRAFT_1214552 [Scleroderma citrinum Foug A]
MTPLMFAQSNRETQKQVSTSNTALYSGTMPIYDCNCIHQLKKERTINAPPSIPAS